MGKYSLKENSDICQNCPNYVTCLGGFTLDLESGYWRIDNKSDLIEECFNSKSNCLGGTSSFTCAEGHHGALCEACDLFSEEWPEPFANSGTFSCGKCSSVTGNIIKLALIFFLTIVNLIILIKLFF